jgi:hypothetical protein
VVALDTSADGLDWSAQLHFAYIKPLQLIPAPPLFPVPPPPSLQSNANYNLPIDSIAGDIRIIRDATECQMLEDSQNKDEKKEKHNGWDKLPDMVREIIQKLSVVSDDLLPKALAESYLKQLKQPKVFGLAMVINIELSLQGCQVEVPTTMVNAIKTGIFHSSSLMVAHPFSIFNVPYMDAVSMTSYNKTELDLLQSEGEGIPKEMVKKLTENRFCYPFTTHNLYHQFNNWYGVCKSVLVSVL